MHINKQKNISIMIKIIFQSMLFRALAATLIIISGTVVLTMTFGSRDPNTKIAKTGMPWEVDPVSGGFSRVFGITLGQSTLGDAIDQMGESLQIAIVTPLAVPSETSAAIPPSSALEAYVEPMRTQFLSGRLVISVKTRAEDLVAWRERSVRHQKSDTGAHLDSLSSEDMIIARRATIIGLTYIPGAKLDESVIQTRFGNDGYRQNINADLVEWKFPSKGVVISLNAKGRDLLQYVAPKDFDATFGTTPP
jgi:hypothetical protein